MTALARGIPLSLLADLAEQRGPNSRHIHRREQADLSWLRGVRRQATRAQEQEKQRRSSAG